MRGKLLLLIWAISVFFGGIAESIMAQPCGNGGYACRTLSVTRYKNIANCGQEVWEDECVDCDNTWLLAEEYEEDNNDLVTHILYPYSGGDMCQADYQNYEVIGYRWNDQAQKNVIPVCDKNGSFEDTRQPLILIHGRQGEPSDIAPGELTKYELSPDVYWKQFIRYYESTEALNSKYRLYLYRYASYKHVTFNARMLSNLLYEVDYIKDWIENKGRRITIVAHSNGGLVARSFLEEHGVWHNSNWSDENKAEDWKLYKKGYQILDKLITLATPHHGSPGAIYNWIKDRGGWTADFLNMVSFNDPDMMDLWWDSYDRAFEQLSVRGDLGSNILRSRSDTPFDNHYRKLLWNLPSYLDLSQEPQIDDIWFYLREQGTIWYHFRYDAIEDDYENFINSYFNPWLYYLNNKKHREQQAEWKERYIFYVGHNDNDDNHSANKLADPDIGGQLTDNKWGKGIYNLGYINDFLVPLTSAVFDHSSDWIDRNGNYSLCGWKSCISPGQEFLDNDSQNVYTGFSTDGYAFRVFKDYNHGRMKDGAVLSIYPPKNNLQDEPIEQWTNCLPPSQYWFITGFSRDVGCMVDPYYDNIESAQNRADYIREASDNVFDFANDATLKRVSPLQYEPLFLMLKKDLVCNFPDVPDDHPYKEAITKLCMLDVIQGYSDGTFRPDITAKYPDGVNRAEFAKMVIKTANALGAVFAASPLNTFSDTWDKQDEWYFPYINILSSYNCTGEGDTRKCVINGYDDNTFRPFASISRTEMLKMVIQTFLFKDLPKCDIDDWYCPYAKQAAKNGIEPFKAQDFFIEEKLALEYQERLNEFKKYVSRGEVAEALWKIYQKCQNARSGECFTMF